MSESEGKPELSGLARSIDALFASSPTPAVFVPEEPVIEEAIPIDVVVGAAPVEMSPLEAPASEGASDLERDDGVKEDEEVQGDAEAQQNVEPEGSVEGVPDTDDEPEATGTPEPEVAWEAEDVPDLEDDEPAPSPLVLATEAYLEGASDRADEIRTLAGELVEKNEIDPIAQAVALLAVGAGSPRDEAIYGVAESIMSPVVLGRLARRIGSERDEDRRKEYFVACGVIGEPMAQAIRDDLSDSTERLARRIHYDALISMGDASRGVIEEMAVDDNRFLVRNAVAILGEVGGERAVELVTSALANPDSRVRREALLALAKLGDEESGQFVIGMLQDPDAEVRLAAAVAVGELRVERALRSLIAMLDDSKDPDEALPLIRALGQLGDPGAVSSIEKHAIRSLFSKPRTDVRVAAYRALNHIGTPRARRLLNQAVSDKDAEVKAAVKDLLNMR
jgi:hypothetical protein